VSYTASYLENLLADQALSLMDAQAQLQQANDEVARLEQVVADAAAASSASGAADEVKPNKRWAGSVWEEKQRRKLEFHGWQERTAALVVMVRNTLTINLQTLMSLMVRGW
jgi:hypothetical protein